jgi:hypothetical protein
VANVKEYADLVTLRSTNTAVGDFLQQDATNQVVLRFDLRTNNARAGFQGLTATRTGTSVDSDVKNVKLWYDTDGTGLFDPATDIVLGTGTFGVPASGLARISVDTNAYSTDLNDLTTGPLKIDTVTRNLNTYFLTYDIATTAEPQRTLGISISSGIYVNITSPNVLSSTGVPANSRLRTIIPKPQVLRVDKEYYFTSDGGHDGGRRRSLPI